MSREWYTRGNTRIEIGADPWTFMVGVSIGDADLFVRVLFLWLSVDWSLRWVREE